jgi:hypothetical protein
MEEIFVDINIPIRPYLKKWIASNKDVEPFIISLTRCHFSAIILEPLKKNRVKTATGEKKFLTTSICCRMSSTVMRESKFWFDEDTIMIIDKRLKAMFDQQLIDFITITNKEKGDIKDSILIFMDYYDLSEDDISWETLVKMYYRARYYVPPEKVEKINQIKKQQLELQFA